MSTTSPSDGSEAPALLRVVKGDPSAEEVAALVAVVSALTAGARTRDVATPPGSEWTAHHDMVRGTHRHGPGAWRASAR